MIITEKSDFSWTSREEGKNKMRILVTGANGYLGQGVVKALCDMGEDEEFEFEYEDMDDDDFEYEYEEEDWDEEVDE